MVVSKTTTFLALLTASVVGFLLTCPPHEADAQSFNCRYAKTADEILICQDSRLAQLDEQLATIYSRLRNSVSPRERALLEGGEKRWLDARTACGRDAACISALYQQRIRQLLAY
jgi:uncharacterized protein